MNGVMYTATGEKYVDEALVSIASVRRWNPDLAVAVFTDDPARFDGHAAHIFEIQPRTLPRMQSMLPRLECMARTPFDRTLALDTDTVILGAIGDVFDVLDRFSVAICHGHQRGRRFAQARVDGKAKIDIPYAFAPVQGGVVLFGGREGLDFVDEVAKMYVDKQYLDDQISMREILWDTAHRVTVLPPEFNIWQIDELRRWRRGGFETAWPKIFHTVVLKYYLTPAEIDDLLLPIAREADTARSDRLAHGFDQPATAAVTGRSVGVKARLAVVRRTLATWRTTKSLQRAVRSARRR